MAILLLTSTVIRDTLCLEWITLVLFGSEKETKL